MSKTLNNLNWKPIKLEGAVVNNDIEDLIGIEECTDYDINSIITKKSKKRKQTATPDFKTKPKKVRAQSDNAGDSLLPSKDGSSTSVSVTQEDNSEDVLDIQAWNAYGLPENVLKAIQEQGFVQPTPIQMLALPPAILGRRDILGAAETGSGKTLAFGLPMLAGILKIKEKEQNTPSVKEDSESECEESELLNLDGGIGCVKVINNMDLDSSSFHKPLYGLILTPTRELAVQVKNHLTAVAKYTGIRVAVVVGGMAVVKQERILSKGPEIVVATPGRLWELIQEGNTHLSQINDLRFLAIDETDRMVEKGHFSELQDLLERINIDENKRKQRQNFVFSATLTLTHELPRHLALKKKLKGKKGRKVAEMSSQQKLQQIIDMLGITNPKVIDVTQKSGTAETLSECRITCALEEKDYYVYYFLQRHPGRTLIFCNSIGCVKRLTTLLSLLNCNPLPLHASMQQRQRLKNLDRFRDNENSIMIATDVAARGLDIPYIEHVLHYQTPRTSESYVHRSGRTARVSRQGITVLLMEPAELQNYLRLCRNLGKDDGLPIFPVHENMLNAVKERVKLARELDKLDLQIRKTNSETGWLEKAAEEMDIIIDENITTKYDKKESRSLKKVAEVKRKQLMQLLAKPIFPKGFHYKYPLSSVQSSTPFNPMSETGEKAIEVLKGSLENDANKNRKKAKWLFKPKRNLNVQQNSNFKVVSANYKKQKKNKRQGKQ